MGKRFMPKNEREHDRIGSYGEDRVLARTAVLRLVLKGRSLSLSLSLSIHLRSDPQFLRLFINAGAWAFLLSY